MKTINDILPIYAIEENVIINTYGHVTVGYRVNSALRNTLTDAIICNMHDKIKNGVLSFSEGVTIHKQDIYTKDKYKATPEKNYIIQSLKQHFDGRGFIRHESYIYFTKQLTTKKKGYNIFPTTVPTNYQKNIEGFSEEVKTCVGAMETAVLSFEKLTGDELESLITGMIYEDISQDIHVKPDFKIGNDFIDIYTLKKDEYPAIHSSVVDEKLSTDETTLDKCFIEPLTFIDCNHIINCTIDICDQIKERKSLEQKKKNVQSMVSNSASSVQLLGIDTLINELDTYNYKLCTFNFNVQIRSGSLEERARNKDLLISAFSKMNIPANNLAQTQFESLPMFFSSIPGCASLVPEAEKTKHILQTPICLFNLETYSKDSHKGIMFQDRTSHTPVYLEMWDNPKLNNKNRLIFGPSGTGKSFLTNHVLAQESYDGNHIVVIDIGGSYKKLCALNNGVYHEYTSDNPISFNLFNIDNPFKYTGENAIRGNYKEKQTEYEEKKILFETVVFAILKFDNKDNEMRAISAGFKALIDLYYKENRDEENYSFTAFYDYVIKLNDRKEADIKDIFKFFKLDSFKLILKDYAHGAKKAMLNSESKKDFLDEKFIVFELDAIKDNPETFSIVTIIIIETVMQKIAKKKALRKTIMIDEAWKAITSKEMIGFVEYLYRTVRKHNGEVMIATQDPMDIMSSKIAQAIRSNTDTLYCLDHKTNYGKQKEELQKLLQLSNKEIALLFSVDHNFGGNNPFNEVFIKMNEESAVYRLEVSKENYAAYTSRAEDNAKIYEDYKKLGDMKIALKNFVEQMN